MEEEDTPGEPEGEEVRHHYSNPLIEALFTLVRFRMKHLRLHYTTENACHVTIHAGATVDMYSRFPII